MMRWLLQPTVPLVWYQLMNLMKKVECQQTKEVRKSVFQMTREEKTKDAVVNEGWVVWQKMFVKVDRYLCIGVMKTVVVPMREQFGRTTTKRMMGKCRTMRMREKNLVVLVQKVYIVWTQTCLHHHFWISNAGVVVVDRKRRRVGCCYADDVCQTEVSLVTLCKRLQRRPVGR